MFSKHAVCTQVRLNSLRPVPGVARTILSHFKYTISLTTCFLYCRQVILSRGPASYCFICGLKWACFFVFFLQSRACSTEKAKSFQRTGKCLELHVQLDNMNFCQRIVNILLLMQAYFIFCMCVHLFCVFSFIEEKCYSASRKYIFLY